ncbi:MAG: AAA family ATPase [Anaerovorax sp.]|nr:AAA family ATPase [Anaerovorax sp.]
MENKVKIISMDTVEVEEIKWLWKPYIPFGKLTIIQGDPGEGKTTFALHVAALLSQGKRFDGNAEPFEPVNVIYQTAEDGLSDTVKPRLISAGADCSKIKVIDDNEKSLSMDDERLEIAIKETGAKLLILDPLQAYLGDRIDMNRANEAREMTKKLGALAERTGCAVVLIGHMNKGSGSKAAYRGIGSIDFYAIARSVLLVAKVPQDPNIRAVAQIKSNLAAEGDTVAFRLDENGFTWIGEYDVSADELLAGYSNSDKHKAAEDFLKKILSNGQTVPASTIFAQAKSIGVSKRTLENVKQELAIKSIKDGASWLWKMD